MSDTNIYNEENLPSRQEETGFNESSGTGESPLYELKKKVIRPVLFKMVFLTIIQLVLLLILLVTSITNILYHNHYIVIFFYAFPTMVTLVLSLLLWKRQIWAIGVTRVLSFVPLMYAIFIFLLLPGARFDEETEAEVAYFFMRIVLSLLYAPVVIISCSWALDRYSTLKAELKKDQIALQDNSPNANPKPGV